MTVWVGVALKWVDHRPTVDPLTGAVGTDARSSGPSEADLAALEWALRMGQAWAAEVVAATVGPAPAAAVLEVALSAGADRAVRVEAPSGAASWAVAGALAPVFSACAAVVCGDGSLDRGSGSVPAFLAAELGAAQALGLVAVEVVAAPPGTVKAERRLDGGRRERLVVAAPSVVSVEGGTARLRRAPLGRVLFSHRVAVEVVVPSRPLAPEPAPARVGPFRPRPRALAGPDAALPARQRVAALVGGTGATGHVRGSSAEVMVAAPAQGAERLLAALRDWGELPS